MVLSWDYKFLEHLVQGFMLIIDINHIHWTLRSDVRVLKSQHLRNLTETVSAISDIHADLTAQS